MTDTTKPATPAPPPATTSTPPPAPGTTTPGATPAAPGIVPGQYVAFATPAPDPKRAPVGPISNVYAFTVHLKSDIARGSHRGETVYVTEPDPATATAKLQTYYGTDLANLIGPILAVAGVQL